MTRKDFVLIAEIIRTMRTTSPDSEAVLDDLTNIFANRLSTTNENFDRDRFIEACR